MATQTNKVVAMDELMRLTQFDVEPTIDEADLDTILTNAQICSVWEPSKPYSYADVVIPTTAHQNGRRYKCIKSGTSASSEPTWSEFQGGRASDGPTLIWEECGAQPKSLWDMRAAAHAGWLDKAAKATNAAKFTTSASSRRVSSRPRGLPSSCVP
jgi:hypothetical protein